MNRYASLSLSIASVFFLVMAILVNSPPLFYMVTAVLATLGAAAVQAYLAVRALRFERFIPPAVQVGEQVTIEITVWSERRIMRPLITILDDLPERLASNGIKAILPIAPSFDQPIQTRYTFRPMKRGRYRWSSLTVRGTDALGLVSRERQYQTDPVSLTVYPAPMPAAVEIRPTSGWGASDLESGRKRGSGLEPRGIREYVHGDALRHIHWPSSARTGTLMVKDFETGTGLNLSFVLQQTSGSEVGTADSSTLESMCGNALFIANRYLEIGATITFPTAEDPLGISHHPETRIREIREVLTDIQADQQATISEEIARVQSTLSAGSTVVIMLGAQDVELPGAILNLASSRTVCLVYDLDEYRGSSPLPRKLRRAADSDYLSKLEAAGAEVIMMPKVESVR